MSIGPFQHLSGSHETAGANTLACEPWLLPISDRPDAAPSATDESLRNAVRQASRPFWIAANALCVALGLMLTIQATTGWMAPARSIPGPMAQAAPPTIPAQTAAFAGSHHD
ncbi:hypothetical protein [Methylobacterium sp. sgz302541]|uniref:hypothetical protein n=1 Tax=unclassified Methylobacterium TaxID=2615210 RepID=UPI003D35040A